MRLLVVVIVMLFACQGGNFFQSASNTDQNSASADAQGDGTDNISTYALANDCQTADDGVDLCNDDGSTVTRKGSKQLTLMLKRYGGKLPTEATIHTIKDTVNPTIEATPHTAGLDDRTHTTTATMVEETKTHPSVSFDQLTRKTRSDSFDQRGIHAQQHNKTFTQSTQSRRRVLDILMVIDSSGSMLDEQTILANQLPTLMNYVSNEDWQVAVVNTEPRCSMKGVTSNPNTYRRLIKVGAKGGTEYTAYNAVRAMNGQCGHSRWLRANSTIAVIILTDEPHQCPNNCSPSYLIRHLQSIRPNNYAVYGLVYPGDNSWGNIFNHRGAVNSRSYASVLGQIGSNIQQVLEKTFPIPSVPDSNSLQVTVNGQTTTNYTLNGQTVLFDRGYVPPSGSSIVVSWTTGFRPFDNSWTLSEIPLNGTVSAVITKNGQQLRTLTSNQYTLSGRTLTLPADQIEQLMPQGARLTITYKENRALHSNFSFTVPGGSGQIRSTINVSVNGQSQTAGSHYDLSGSTITFKNNHLPPEGASILIDSFKYRFKDKLAYDVPLHRQNKSHETVCSVAGREVECTRSGDTVTITSGNFQNAQQLTVVQYLQSTSTASPLRKDFIINTVKLTTDGQSCLGRLNELDIDNATINLDRYLDPDNRIFNSCPAIRDAPNDAEYTVTYRYQVFTQDLTFPDSIYNKAKPYKTEIYVVYVNGSELDGEAYEISDGINGGKKIDFVNTLPSDAEVEATLYLLPPL